MMIMILLKNIINDYYIMTMILLYYDRVIIKKDK